MRKKDLLDTGILFIIKGIKLYGIKEDKFKKDKNNRFYFVDGNNKKNYNIKIYKKYCNKCKKYHFFIANYHIGTLTTVLMAGVIINALLTNFIYNINENFNLRYRTKKRNKVRKYDRRTTKQSNFI